MHIWAVLATAALAEQDLKVSPPYLWEVIDTTSRVRFTKDKKGHDHRYYELRTKENCKFPLDIVILQDKTESFQDNIDSMRETQLDLIYQGITAEHPDSKFAVVSFMDKPVTPLGNRDDYCTQFDAPLEKGIEKVKEAYSKYEAYGGYDAPENQFGTLYNVLTSNKVNWSNDSAATKLVVISTDAGPHFAGDSQDGLLPPFDPSKTSDDDMADCVARYYPSAEQMRSAISHSGAYVASLVYDGDWANGWPSKSWITFNDYIGQSPDFVASQAPDSSDFWGKLAKIIQIVEDEQCQDDTTPAPETSTKVGPPLSTEIPPPPVSTVGPPVSTVGPTETTAAPAETTTGKDNGCSCPCDNCGCCAEVVIRLQHRPSVLHLDIENPAA